MVKDGLQDKINENWIYIYVYSWTFLKFIWDLNKQFNT